MQPDDVRKARDTLGLTQMGFAHELGVNLSTVWRWENDKMSVGRMAQKAIERLLEQGVTGKVDA